MPILITGTSGQVGGEVLRLLAAQNPLTPSSAELNLADESSIRAYVRQHRPTAIVNAAAYTAVDKAESEPSLAAAINADAPRVLGEEAKALGATLLHFSTDYVFDGSKPTPYVETDGTGPLNVYGATKLAGEQALVATGANALIFRTSWVYGATGKNFLRTMLKLAHEREVLNIVGDQHGAPTWSRDLARLAAHILTLPSVQPGIYHAGGSGETTWAGFAQEIVRLEAERDPAARLATIAAIPSSSYPTPAARPMNSRMSNDKLFETFGYRMMEWRESTRRVVEELASNG